MGSAVHGTLRALACTASTTEVSFQLDEIIKHGDMNEALRAALDRRRFYIDRSEVDPKSESDWSSDDDYR